MCCIRTVPEIRILQIVRPRRAWPHILRICVGVCVCPGASHRCVLPVRCCILVVSKVGPLCAPEVTHMAIEPLPAAPAVLCGLETAPGVRQRAVICQPRKHVWRVVLLNCLCKTQRSRTKQTHHELSKSDPRIAVRDQLCFSLV